MGRLTNLGPGDITDRLTILSLKILNAGARETTHWKAEQTALLSQIRSRTLNGVWFAAVLDLAAVNGMLWVAEDQLRALRANASGSVDWAEAGAVAFQIQTLNDRRSALIDQINKDAGEYVGAEKLA